MDRGAWQATVHGGQKESDTMEVTWRAQGSKDGAVTSRVHPFTSGQDLSGFQCPREGQASIFLLQILCGFLGEEIGFQGPLSGLLRAFCLLLHSPSRRGL